MHECDLCARVDAACQSAGVSDAGWNARFRAALRGNGVELITYHGERLTDAEVMAPVPYDGPAGWPESYLRISAALAEEV